MAHRLPGLVREKDKEGAGILSEEITALGATEGVGLTQVGISDRHLAFFKPHATHRIEGKSRVERHSCLPERLSHSTAIILPGSPVNSAPAPRPLQERGSRPSIRLPPTPSNPQTNDAPRAALPGPHTSAAPYQTTSYNQPSKSSKSGPGTPTLALFWGRTSCHKPDLQP